MEVKVRVAVAVEGREVREVRCCCLVEREVSSVDEVGRDVRAVVVPPLGRTILLC